MDSCMRMSNVKPFIVSRRSTHIPSTNNDSSMLAGIQLCRCHRSICPVWGRGTPLPPFPIYFLIFSPFHFSLSFIGFTYFLLLSIPSLSTRIVPLRFRAGGSRRRPNLVLVCFFVLYFVLSVFLS